MAKFLLLIMAVALAFNNFAQGFVLPHFAQLMGADYEYAEETPVAPTPTPNYIMRIKKPSERREPASDEITKVIVASAAGQSFNNSNQMSAEVTTIEAPKDAVNALGVAPQRQSKTLTYTDLDKLLAHWQLEKERNAYEMQSSNRHRNAALRK